MRCSSSYAMPTVTGSATRPVAGSGQLDDNDRARLEAVALLACRSVDRHRSVDEEPLGKRPRPDLGSRRERAVEARPCVVVSDREAKRRHRVPMDPVRAIAEDERAEEDRDADDDEGVREVERRPRDEVEEVGHVPEPDAVDEVGDASADDEPERDGQDRMAPPGPREEARASRRRRSP